MNKIHAFLGSILVAAFVMFSAAPQTIAQGTPAKSKIKTTATVERHQCEAVTKKGRPCSRKTAEGEKYCKQHLKMMAKEASAVPMPSKVKPAK